MQHISDLFLVWELEFAESKNVEERQFDWGIYMTEYQSLNCD